MGGEKEKGRERKKLESWKHLNRKIQCCLLFFFDHRPSEVGLWPVFFKSIDLSEGEKGKAPLICLNSMGAFFLFVCKSIRAEMGWGFEMGWDFFFSFCFE